MDDGAFFARRGVRAGGEDSVEVRGDEDDRAKGRGPRVKKMATRRVCDFAP